MALQYVSDYECTGNEDTGLPGRVKGAHQAHTYLPLRVKKLIISTHYARTPENSEAGRLKCVSLLSVLFLLVKAAEAFWYSVRVIFLDLLTYGTESPLSLRCKCYEIDVRVVVRQFGIG